MGTVILVRHGQASFGAEDYDHLSERGLAQSRALGEWLATRGIEPSVVLHGGLRRQRDTTRAVLEAAGWPVTAAVDDGWDEFDHLAVVRALPGHPVVPGDRREFQKVFEAALERWTSAASNDYPEPYGAFLDRVGAAVDRACEAAGPGATVLVSSSGGPIAAAVTMLLGLEADRQAQARSWRRLNAVLVNSSYSRVVVGGAGARLLTFNEHPHLTLDQVTYR